MTAGKKTFIGIVIGWAALVLILLAAEHAIAAGTAAGTNITNQAAANYTIGGSNYIATSNVSTFRVNELVSHTLTWLDAAPGVSVLPGQTGRPTTFRLTNTGNGTDTYTLSAVSAGIIGDQFDPLLVNIYLDGNGNNVYDPGVDPLYSPGINDPVLGADGSATIFVLNDIPASGLGAGNLGNTRLTAVSSVGTGAPGTIFPGQGDGGTDAVLGASGGTQSATGAYVVSDLSVTVSKTVQVVDQGGGSVPVPGATLRYTLTVTVTGSGTASNVVITDPIPTNTTYRNGTLRLNNAVLTDAADADKGDFGITTPNAVTVNLGNLTSSSPAQTIIFETMIN